MIATKIRFRRGSWRTRSMPAMLWSPPFGPPLMKTTQTPFERNRWLSIVLGFVAIEATAFSLRGALVPRFVELFDTTTRLAGLLAPAATAGFVATLVLTGLIATSEDTEQLLMLGTGVTGICFLAAAFAPSFGVLLIALFGRGIATGVFRGVDRPLLSKLYEESRERVFNYYDLAWAGGAAIAPAISVLALQTIGWRPVYAILAIGCFILAGLAFKGQLNFLQAGQTRIDWEDFISLASSSRLRQIAFVMFLLGGVEGGLFTWLPLYTNRAEPAVSGATALTVLLVAYIPGRFIHATLSAQIKTARYLVAIASGAISILILTVWAANGGLFLAGVAGLGFLLAGVFPTTIALAVNFVPEQAAPLNAGLTAVSYLGIATWPPIAGHLSYSSDISLLALPAILGVPLVSTLYFVSRGDSV